MILFVEVYGGIKGRVTGMDDNVILKLLNHLRKILGFTICQVEM